MNRFDIKTESKLNKAILKLKGQEQDCLSEEQALALPAVAVLDSANVCLIQANTEEAKRLLSKFINIGDLERIKVPELSYNNDGLETTSKYSLEYLGKIVNIFLCFVDSKNDDGLKISVKHDYPSTFENEHFKIILAPRVENN